MRPLLKSVVWLIASLWPWLAHAAAAANVPRIGEAPPALSLSETVQGPKIEAITWAQLEGKVVVKWELTKTESAKASDDPAKIIQAARDQLGLALRRVTRELPMLVVETQRFP